MPKQNIVVDEAFAADLANRIRIAAGKAICDRMTITDLHLLGDLCQRVVNSVKELLLSRPLQQGMVKLDVNSFRAIEAKVGQEVSAIAGGDPSPIPFLLGDDQ